LLVNKKNTDKQSWYHTGAQKQKAQLFCSCKKGQREQQKNITQLQQPP
jgi:hypothetical protein